MSHDTIIVGGGSAGCVLAARLTADGARSVLLIEAGPDYPEPAALPPEIVNGLAPTYSHDWEYYSEPGSLGRVIRLPRARIIGGCSATNATFALRGAPASYDEWAALGNRGWSFAELLPFFRALESDRDFAGPYHGTDGPIPIRRARDDELTASQRAFLETCWTDGHRRADDLNAPDAIGAAAAPMNLVNGVRQSTAVTYLAAARSRANLHIRAGALTDRVLFAGSRAVGVQLAGGERIQAGEVILAAGAFGSPAILWRSGVGPAGQLRALGVGVVADVPGVGENLMDHPLFSVRCAAPSSAQEQGALFQTVLLLRSRANVSCHDLMIAARSATSAAPADSPTGAHFSLIASLVSPRSRGRLWLRSTDPSAAPAIDLGYFSDPADMPRLVEAVRVARRFARTAPLAALNAGEIGPGPARSDDDGDLERTIRAAASTFHHAVGTCRMAPASDLLGVVDDQARVRGVDGLRVVDASIMPTIPSANTNVPTIMIAERVAAILLGEGERSSSRRIA